MRNELWPGLGAEDEVHTHVQTHTHTHTHALSLPLSLSHTHTHTTPNPTHPLEIVPILSGPLHKLITDFVRDLCPKCHTSLLRAPRGPLPPNCRDQLARSMATRYESHSTAKVVSRRSPIKCQKANILWPGFKSPAKSLICRQSSGAV